MAHRLPMIEKCPHCETGTAARRGKRFNSKGEFTQWEFTCRDCKAFWSIRAGGDLNLVPNDLAVIPVSAIEPFPGLPENERLIRQVFSLYPRWNRGQIGRALGRSREWVRQVLVGITSAHIAPDLERFSKATFNATCHGCVMALGSGEGVRCSIGIPEAVDNPDFAVLCAVFEPKEGGTQPPSEPDQAAAMATAARRERRAGRGLAA